MTTFSTPKTIKVLTKNGTYRYKKIKTEDITVVAPIDESTEAPDDTDEVTEEIVDIVPVVIDEDIVKYASGAEAEDLTVTDITAVVEEIVQPQAEVSLLPVRRKKVNYLNNRDLLAQVILSKEKGHMTHDLAKMLQMLCYRYAQKGNYVGYSYNEDMQAYAMLQLVKTWHCFDHLRFYNPFAFFTQCVKNSFNHILKQEKNQRVIRDDLLVSVGMTPSFGYAIENSDEYGRNTQLDASEAIRLRSEIDAEIDPTDNTPPPQQPE